MKLHGYQKQTIKSIDAHWRAGTARVIAVAPTGAGKGVIAARLLARAAKAGERALFMVHRRDIAEDIANRVRVLGVRVGMVLPGHARDDQALVQVASVQSLIESKSRPYDLVIVDEAHHYRADEWERVLKRIGTTRLVGFTATPQRSDGKNLGKVFDELVTVVSYAELVRLGVLVPTRLLIPARKLAGNIAMEPADAYLKHARGRSAFIFLRDLKTSKSVRAKLAREGVKAEIVTDETPAKQRTQALEDLREGKITAIINYGTMTEGVDAPIVSCVVLEQPCNHEGGFVQRAGRAMRSHHGKVDAMVIDLAGTAYKHGKPWETEVTYHLSGDPIRLACGLVEVRRRDVEKSGPLVEAVEMIEADTEWLARNGGPRLLDWGEVDWSLSNKEIAKAIGASHSTVCFYRSRLGMGQSAGRIGKKLGISVDTFVGVNWEESDASIAVTLGISPATVRIWRHAILGKNRRDGREASLANVNWLLSDSEIARQTGLSNYIVGMVRRSTGRMASEHSRKIHSSAFDNVDWKLTNQEIATQVGCSTRRVWKERKFRGERRWEIDKQKIAERYRRN